MSLQPLEWRKLPTRTLWYAGTSATQSVSRLLDNIYDMMTGSVYFDGSIRVVGSGSAWQIPTKVTVSSKTEALYMFPAYQTQVSQSVIIAGRESTSTTTSLPQTASNEPALTANYVYIANVKNASGSFIQYNSTYPFGSGSYSTGYVAISPTASSISVGDKITIYESKEALSIFFYETSGNSNYGGIAGAIVDPEQSSPTSSFDAETDGRLYGVTSTGPVLGALSATFLTDGSTIQAFTHNYTTGSIGYPRFIVFAPSQNSTRYGSIEKFNSNQGFSPSAYYTTLSGKTVTHPIKCAITEFNTNYIGRFRDITFTKKSANNSIIRNSSTGTTLGFVLSASEVSLGETIMFNYS
jgi:hypothetical protein